MEQKQQLAEQMQRTLRDMLNASFEQERLGDQTGNLSPASPRLNDIAAEQARLSSNANQLIAQILDIANKTFLLSPQLNREMSEVMKNIQQAISSLENRNTQRASLHQKKAMAGLNNALLSLQNSMDQMSQASSASGFQEMMQQLQKLSGQQGQLNQESMMLFKQGQSGRRELSTEDMARLAAQQEMIKKSLEKLSGEMGSRRDVLGRLDDLGREMEDIVQELKKEKLNRKVIERQQRILSRLLDAQKSIREKEFSRKRVAEREEPAIRKSPPQLREELMRKEDLLRKHLLEALDEGYVLEYKELIKKYFESLARQPEVIE
jgi:hypothetical protein